MANIDLGIVYEPHPTELAEIEAALSVVTDGQPERKKLVGYAGPNDVVQLLIDAATWQNALSGLALIFGATFVRSFSGELGKLSATEVWKNRESYSDAVKQATAAPFNRLVVALNSFRNKGQTTTIAVRIEGTERNAGFILTSEDPSVVAWQMACITLCASEIRQIVLDNPDLPWKDSGNPDLSIKIDVLENGDISILGKTISKNIDDSQDTRG